MAENLPQYDVRLSLVIAAGEDNHVFEKRITLPFVPVVGMILNDDEYDHDCDGVLEIAAVTWSIERQEFYIDLTDDCWPEDPRPDMTARGWTDVNEDEPP